MATTKAKRGKPKLIIERSDSKFFGRVTVNNNLIIDHADSIQLLNRQLKKLIYKFENVAVDDFDIVYDLTSFFTAHPLNIGDVAKKAAISPVLMRQYASGVKFPSGDRLQQIEKAINEIGRELSKVKLSKHRREYA
jgi:glycine cleavage system regulatory protein